MFFITKKRILDMLDNEIDAADFEIELWKMEIERGKRDAYCRGRIAGLECRKYRIKDLITRIKGE